MEKHKTSRPVTDKIKTKIWSEVPFKKGKDIDNKTLCYGYDFYNDLLGKFQWHELLFLQLKGELPSKKESSILNLLMSSIINPGPRDWSTQSAMTAAVTKTTVGNCLLAGMAVLQGRYQGALCVEKSMSMLQKGYSYFADEKKSMSDIINIINEKYTDFPGLGLHYYERDQRAVRLIELLKEEGGSDKYFCFALEVEKYLSKEKGIWLTITGVVAAALSDLGFTPHDGHGIFLISATPGILAHLLEQMQGGWNTYPFYDTPEYEGSLNLKLHDSHKVYTED